MGVAITSKAVTLPILKIVQGGKLNGMAIGEGMTTEHGVYQLVEIGCPELHIENEVAVSFKWVRLSHEGGHHER